MASPSERSFVPAPSTPLIGRERDLALVRSILLEKRARLVTLTGVGGVGKTRLALQLSRDLREAFPGGVVFVSLGAIADPWLVASSVCRAMGLPDGDENSLIDYLEAAREPGSLLLVLDNFEQLLPAAPTVSSLLAGVGRLSVLVTSRAVLGLAGEHVFEVRPLALPSGVLGLGHLQDVAAIRLFSERALAATRDFSFTEDAAPTVVEVCRRLEGIPLAIELAASRLRVLGLSELLARLDRPLTLLTGGGRDSPDRQQTLRKTIAWSADLLPAPTMAVFRRLAVFAGGWTLSSADQVAGEAGAGVLDAVNQLADQSLVTRSAEGDGESRFGMLETVREYALELLDACGEGAATRRRHLTFCIAIAEAANAEFGGDGQAQAFARLASEHQNLRAALTFALTNSPADALRLAAALGRFWEIRGHITEGRRWLTESLESASDRGPLRAKALQQAGTLARHAGDFEEARRLLQESLELYEGTPADAAEGARTWFEIAQVAHYVGDFEEVARACRHSLDLYEALSDRKGVAVAKGLLGHAGWHLQDYSAARAVITESMAVWRDLGDTLSVSWGYWDLGNISRDEGRVQESRELYRESLAGAQRAGDILLLAVLIEAFGSLEFLAGRPAIGARMLGAASAILEAHGIARVSTYDRDVYLPLLASLRGALPAPAFEAEWAAGKALGVEDATALALRGAVGEEAVSDQSVAAGFHRDWRTRARAVRLTEREADVLRLIADGCSNQEIADALAISLNTVYRHVSNVLAKTGAANRTAAALFAVRHRLGQNEPA